MTRTPTRSIRVTRSLAVIRIQRELEDSTYPRIQMGLIVAITGATGWLASAVLLHLGMERMVQRYPLALAVAYLVFLGLLWLWLHTRAQDYHDAADVADVIDLTLPSRNNPEVMPTIQSGNGGDFAGGGASGRFDGPTDVSTDEPGMLSSLGDAAGAVSDGDELAIPLLAIALAVGLALASLYVVYIAPALFAELLFDGVLSYSLYRRLRRAESSHWFSTAVQRTLIPFALTAVFVALVGVGLAAYAPGAHTLGQALRATER